MNNKTIKIKMKKMVRLGVQVPFTYPKTLTCKVPAPGRLWMLNQETGIAIGLSLIISNPS
jgi:hypothetical protein